MIEDPNRRPLRPDELRPLLLHVALDRRSAEPGPIEELFFTNAGRAAVKWIHYLPFYDQVFAPFRGKPVRMLEIGVFQGGSLELWRRYFGPEAVLFGIDIDPACTARVDPPNEVRIGSQDDANFLAGVVEEMGGVDIVLDDGSHVARHQRAAFQALWPQLNDGGMYVIEDLHTSYMPRWDGGYRRPGTGIELVKELIDDMHAWFHEEGETAAPREELGQISIADSIAAIRKVRRRPPAYTVAGVMEG